MTHVDLLSKPVMIDLTKEVNIVSSISNKAYNELETMSPDEEIWFLSNKMGGSALPINGNMGIKI